MTQLARNPVEGGSVVVRLSFTDEAGVNIEPKEDSVRYTLYAKRREGSDWEIVNDRVDVLVPSASVIDLVFQGQDLVLLPDCITKRRVVVDWVYYRNTEETFGREAIDFEVIPLPTLVS